MSAMLYQREYAEVDQGEELVQGGYSNAFRGYGDSCADRLRQSFEDSVRR